MKVSILLRGHNFLDKDRYGYPLDALDNVDSLLEKLIIPVRNLYPDAKLFLATYESPILADLVQRYAPCELMLLNRDGSSQIDSYKQALKHVFEHDDCDALIVTRFDLAFKKSFPEWNVQVDDHTVIFPWKETLIGWRDHQRVGDTIHIIGRRAMSDFYSCLIMNGLARRPDLHLLYYFMRTLTGNIRFISEGHWDSNPLFANPECDNPLYTFSNRPRLQEFAPYTGMMPREIRGE